MGSELAASLISITGNWPNGLLPAKIEKENNLLQSCESKSLKIKTVNKLMDNLLVKMIK